MIIDKKRKITTKVSQKALIAMFLIVCLSLPVIGGIELVRFAGARTASNEGRIVFARGLGFNFEIYTMNPDGSNVRKLTDNPATDWFPSVSPDGTKIAFSRQPKQGSPEWEIWVMDGSGKNERKLNERGWNTSWSPDGTKIAFDSDREGDWNIYVMDANGTNVKRLTESPLIFVDPDWSPDGRRIVVEEQPPQGGRATQVWVMDADGRNQKMLNDWGKQPAWSPDGKRIAFSSSRAGWAAWKTSDIYVMDANGSNVKILTVPGPSDKQFPDWSPDGTKIAFGSWEGDNPSDLYVMDADGGNVRRLTDTPEWEWSLDWTAYSYGVEPAGKLMTTWGKIKQKLFEK